MSTFVLKREYALQMPTSFVDVDRDEMEYVDGGGTLSLKIGSNSFVIYALSMLGANFTKTSAIAALDAIGLSIAASIELGTAGVGTLFAGAFLLAWGGVAVTIATAAVGYGISSLKGRTFSISNQYFPTATITI